MTSSRLAEWGRRIREAREERGLSQTDLAQLAGLDQSNLSRVERGVQGADDETRMGIAAGLGMRVEEIWTYPEMRTASDGRG